MLRSFLLKPANAQQEAPKSQLDAFKKEDTTQLDTFDMIELKGGRQATKGIASIFSWNTSCGGALPQ